MAMSTQSSTPSIRSFLQFSPLNKPQPTSSLGNLYAVQTFLASTTAEWPHLEAYPADQTLFFQILMFSLSKCPPPIAGRGTAPASIRHFSLGGLETSLYTFLFLFFLFLCHCAPPYVAGQGQTA